MKLRYFNFQEIWNQASLANVWRWLPPHRNLKFKLVRTKILPILMKKPLMIWTSFPSIFLVSHTLDRRFLSSSISKTWTIVERSAKAGWISLEKKRQLWIELLEKEKIKLESSENFELDNFSDCSDDSLDYDDIEVNLFQKHLFLHQLTHNMKKIVHRITSFAHVNYKRRTWAEHGQNMARTCYALVLSFHVLNW